MMKAIVFDRPGNPEVLYTSEREIPKISDNDVLIKVAAAGINRPDIAQRKGNYPAPKGVVQDILGLEVSGGIVEIGDKVTRFQIGDKVCALVAGGGYAEYAAADEGSCLPIPSGIAVEDAAALPEVLFTVWHNLFQRGLLHKGQHALIYGGSGGIGSMAIQLAHLSGSQVSTLVSSQEKEEYCRKLGADTVANYREQNLLEVWNNNTFDVILDSVGGKYLDTNLALLKEEGKLVYINAMEGGKPGLNIFKMMQKRIHITGSTLRPRSKAFKKELAKDILKYAYPLLEHKKFSSCVRYRFSFKEVVEAHRLMDSRDFFGKIIIFF